MKHVVILVLSVSFIFGFSKNEDSTIDMVALKLSSLEQIEYEALFQHIDKRMGYDRQDTAMCYFDFNSNDTLIGTRFHFTSNYGENVFNGSTVFNHYDDQDHVLYNDAPEKYDVSNSFFMSGSVSELRRLLPRFLADSSVSIVKLADSTINDIELFNFEINIDGAFINIGAELTKGESNSKYYLLVYKSDYMPYEFGVNRPPHGFSKTTFTKYNYNPTRADSVWSYDRYSPELLRLSKQEMGHRIRSKSKSRTGEVAPGFRLQSLTGQNVKLSELRDGAVLLEFWFPGCAPCATAIPHLNEILLDYSEKGLKVFGVEMQGAKKSVIEDYVIKHGIEFPILISGENVSNSYGVMAAPTVVIIDTSGKIVYSRAGFIHEEVLEALNSLYN